MTDIKELFDMVETKNEPDLDPWKEQEDRQRRTVRNRKVGAMVVAAAFVAVVVIAFAMLRDGNTGGAVPLNGGDSSAPAEPEPVTTHSYFDIATGEETPVAAKLGGARSLAVSPDGDRIAYGTCCDDDPVFVANLDGSDRSIVTPEKLDGYDPTWIDDETLLIQARPERTDELGDLYTVDVATGELDMVVDLPDERNGAWIIVSDISPDGQTVLYHLPRGKGGNVEYDLWSAPLAGGRPTMLRKDAGYATFASDGSIVFLDHPYPFEGDSIWIMDADGKDARELATGDGPYGWPSASPDGTKVLVGSPQGVPSIIDIETGDVTTLRGVTADEPTWFGNDQLII